MYLKTFRKSKMKMAKLDWEIWKWSPLWTVTLTHNRAYYSVFKRHDVDIKCHGNIDEQHKTVILPRVWLVSPLKAHLALQSESVLVYHLDHWFHLGAKVPSGNFLINQVKTRTLSSHRCICASFQMIKGHPFWCLEEIKCLCLMAISQYVLTSRSMQ